MPEQPPVSGVQHCAASASTAPSAGLAADTLTATEPAQSAKCSQQQSELVTPDQQSERPLNLGADQAVTPVTTHNSTQQPASMLKGVTVLQLITPTDTSLGPGRLPSAASPLSASDIQQSSGKCSLHNTVTEASPVQQAADAALVSAADVHSQRSSADAATEQFWHADRSLSDADRLCLWDSSAAAQTAAAHADSKFAAAAAAAAAATEQFWHADHSLSDADQLHLWEPSAAAQTAAAHADSNADADATSSDGQCVPAEAGDSNPLGGNVAASSGDAVSETTASVPVSCAEAVPTATPAVATSAAVPVEEFQARDAR